MEDQKVIKKRRRGKRGGKKAGSANPPQNILPAGPEQKPKVIGVGCVLEMSDGNLYNLAFNQVELINLIQLSHSIRQDGILPLTLIGPAPKKEGP